MKRLLYILLFLSIGYNVFMFSRMGYDYFKAREWMSQEMINPKATFQTGLEEFNSEIKEKYPDFKRKKYLAIYFMGGPIWHESETMDLDTTEFNPRKIKERRIKRLKSLDSLAGIYNEEVSHVFCFETRGDKTDELIAEISPSCKNVLYVTGMNTLISGYFNEKNNKMKFTPKIFVLDPKNKVLYDNILIEYDQHVPLSKFFKSLPK